MEKGHYVYLVECSDKSLYCGYSNDVEHRIAIHNAGKGAKYTRSRLPVRLVYWEEYVTKEEALRRERSIKQLSRQKKLELAGLSERQ